MAKWERQQQPTRIDVPRDLSDEQQEREQHGHWRERGRLRGPLMPSKPSGRGEAGVAAAAVGGDEGGDEMASCAVRC